MKTYFYYRIEEAKVRAYCQEDNTYETTDLYTMTRSETRVKNRAYFLFKGYDATDEGLLQFANDFSKWRNEIQTDKIFKFDYKKYKNHSDATRQFLIMMCKKKLEEFDAIDNIEFKWIERCANNGLQSCTLGKYDCYGYDGKAFYGTTMASDSFRLPTRKGREMTIKEINLKDLKIGMYHVRITSNDENFRKIFAFSKHDVYTDVSILYAYMCQNTMQVTIELIQDGEPNAYIYGKTKEDGIVTGHHVFGRWYEALMGLKERYPKNKLVKHLLSSSWGYSCKKQRLYVEEDDLHKYNYCLEYNPKYEYYINNEYRHKNGDEYYELINTNQPYEFNIARMKPHLLARGRYIIGKIALLHLEDVVRIQTDNITFSKPHDDIMTKYKTFPQFVPEDKTTGTIEWFHVNKYYNLTRNEKHGFKTDQLSDDELEVL